MVGHTAALKVLRRCKVVRQTMKLKPECRCNLRRIARHLRPLHIDMDGGVEKRVLTVRSLDRLHDAALTCFLDEEAEVVVHYTTLDVRTNGKRIHGFELNVIRETEFAERHGERANAALSKLCISDCMRYLNSRICKNPQLPNESALCISKSHIAATDTSQHICLYTDLLDDPNIAQGIRMRSDGSVETARRISAHLHGLTKYWNHRGIYNLFEVNPAKRQPRNADAWFQLDAHVPALHPNCRPVSSAIVMETARVSITVEFGFCSTTCLPYSVTFPPLFSSAVKAHSPSAVR